MPVDPNEAARRYRDGIQAIGIDAYRQAAQANNSVDAQRALEQAKSDALDINTLVQKYQRGYSGGSGGVNFEG